MSDAANNTVHNVNHRFIDGIDIKEATHSTACFTEAEQGYYFTDIKELGIGEEAATDINFSPGDRVRRFDVKVQIDGQNKKYRLTIKPNGCVQAQLVRKYINGFQYNLHGNASKPKNVQKFLFTALGSGHFSVEQTAKSLMTDLAYAADSLSKLPKARAEAVFKKMCELDKSMGTASDGERRLRKSLRSPQRNQVAGESEQPSITDEENSRLFMAKRIISKLATKNPQRAYELLKNQQTEVNKEVLTSGVWDNSSIIGLSAGRTAMLHKMLPGDAAELLSAMSEQDVIDVLNLNNPESIDVVLPNQNKTGPRHNDIEVPGRVWGTRQVRIECTLKNKAQMHKSTVNILDALGQKNMAKLAAVANSTSLSSVVCSTMLRESNQEIAKGIVEQIGTGNRSAGFQQALSLLGTGQLTVTGRQKYPADAERYAYITNGRTITHNNSRRDGHTTGSSHSGSPEVALLSEHHSVHSSQPIPVPTRAPYIRNKAVQSWCQEPTAIGSKQHEERHYLSLDNGQTMRVQNVEEPIDRESIAAEAQDEGSTVTSRAEGPKSPASSLSSSPIEGTQPPRVNENIEERVHEDQVVEIEGVSAVQTSVTHSLDTQVVTTLRRPEDSDERSLSFVTQKRGEEIERSMEASLQSIFVSERVSLRNVTTRILEDISVNTDWIISVEASDIPTLALGISVAFKSQPEKTSHYIASICRDDPNAITERVAEVLVYLVENKVDEYEQISKAFIQSLNQTFRNDLLAEIDNYLNERIGYFGHLPESDLAISEILEGYVDEINSKPVTLGRSQYQTQQLEAAVASHFHEPEAIISETTSGSECESQRLEEGESRVSLVPLSRKPSFNVSLASSIRPKRMDAEKSLLLEEFSPTQSVIGQIAGAGTVADTYCYPSGSPREGSVLPEEINELYERSMEETNKKNRRNLKNSQGQFVLSVIEYIKFSGKVSPIAQQELQIKFANILAKNALDNLQEKVCKKHKLDMRKHSKAKVGMNCTVIQQMRAQQEFRHLWTNTRGIKSGMEELVELANRQALIAGEEVTRATGQDQSDIVGEAGMSTNLLLERGLNVSPIKLSGDYSVWYEHGEKNQAKSEQLRLLPEGDSARVTIRESMDAHNKIITGRKKAIKQQRELISEKGVVGFDDFAMLALQRREQMAIAQARQHLEQNTKTSLIDDPSVISDRFAEQMLLESKARYRGKRSDASLEKAKKDSKKHDKTIRLVASELIIANKATVDELTRQKWLQDSDDKFKYELREHISSHYHSELTLEQRKVFLGVCHEAFIRSEIIGEAEKCTKAQLNESLDMIKNPLSEPMLSVIILKAPQLLYPLVRANIDKLSKGDMPKVRNALLINCQVDIPEEYEQEHREVIRRNALATGDFGDGGSCDAEQLKAALDFSMVPFRSDLTLKLASSHPETFILLLSGMKRERLSAEQFRDCYNGCLVIFRGEFSQELRNSGNFNKPIAEFEGETLGQALDFPEFENRFVQSKFARARCVNALTAETRDSGTSDNFAKAPIEHIENGYAKFDFRNKKMQLLYAVNFLFNFNTNVKQGIVGSEMTEQYRLEDLASGHQKQAHQVEAERLNYESMQLLEEAKTLALNDKATAFCQEILRTEMEEFDQGKRWGRRVLTVNGTKASPVVFNPDTTQVRPNWKLLNEYLGEETPS
ncbi:hypothetical protein SOPP22_04760 [Shewanella sp. OPT22]|nr:hypothetical protein SOPP22_04760 [Shewanella sp. OPT22]